MIIANTEPTEPYIRSRYAIAWIRVVVGETRMRRGKDNDRGWRESVAKQQSDFRDSGPTHLQHMAADSKRETTDNGQNNLLLIYDIRVQVQKYVFIQILPTESSKIMI